MRTTYTSHASLFGFINIEGGYTNDYGDYYN